MHKHDGNYQCFCFCQYTHIICFIYVLHMFKLHLMWEHNNEIVVNVSNKWLDHLTIILEARREGFNKYFIIWVSIPQNNSEIFSMWGMRWYPDGKYVSGNSKGNGPDNKIMSPVIVSIAYRHPETGMKQILCENGKNTFVEFVKQILRKIKPWNSIPSAFLRGIKVGAQFARFTKGSWNSQILQKFDPGWFLISHLNA